MGGPEGTWRTVPLGEQLLPHCHLLSGTGAGSRFQLDEVVTACQRGMCLCGVHLYVRLCVSAAATYSCQISVDKHGHPSGSLPGAWDILLLL